MPTLIKDGRVVDPSSGTDETLDILIDKGKIVDLKPKIEAAGSRVIDASRLVVAPGFIDMHVHFREPGQEHKETIASGSRAAAKGGFTSVCTMPNTSPVNDSPRVTESIRASAAEGALVNIFPIAALSKELKGRELADMASQLAAGAVAFSDDGRCIQSSRVMARALECAGTLNALVIDHCEDQSLSEGGVMHQGAVSEKLGLRGIPAAAEEIMVARDIILAEAAGSKIHIAHVSTKGSVRLVREAKRRLPHLTAEATPHHLILTDARVELAQANAKVNPPLRDQSDVDALIEAVRDGTIDILATDHAPHSPQEKAAGMENAPFGVVGLETAISLILDRLVHRGIISLARFVEIMSARPARLLDMKGKGRIVPGADADLTILNLHQDVMVNVNTFQSKGRNSPFDGWKLKGGPVMTIVAGRIVYPFPRPSAKSEGKL